ncbi:septum formation family protein [Corynebacterium uterequi]|uniref:Septum formation n=1 Tax=Corynebacterium uterequi TaxID=1072256 RepID=A0A0G3HFD0_9CORY|nr:septum formation family protein [Corynebacterium uterequi]AKK12061.1 Septum formation [Corynebacterium uterequi]
MGRHSQHSRTSTRTRTSARALPSRTIVTYALIVVVALAVGLAAFFGLRQLSSRNAAAPAESPSATSAPGDVVSFTPADVGSCLNWSLDDKGQVTSFERADCETPHRFEVASREDLRTYPSSKFADDAPRPDITQQALLRQELCRNAVLQYVDGRLDPSGRFVVSSILPPESKWAEGDRTMLCGVQSNDAAGNILETTGRVAQVDQARTYEPGTCAAIDDASQITAVPCEQPHQLEALSIVDLAKDFPDSQPTVEEQDELLEETCTQAAIDYLGGGEDGEKSLYKSGLQPYWIPLQPESWSGGSHSTNCFLTHATTDSGFSDITGTAKDLPALQLNGEPLPETPAPVTSAPSSDDDTTTAE